MFTYLVWALPYGSEFEAENSFRDKLFNSNFLSGIERYVSDWLPFANAYSELDKNFSVY